MPGGVDTVIFLLVGGILLAGLVIRRRNPMAAAYIILVGAFAQLLTHGPSPDPSMGDARVRPVDIALGIMLYTLVVYVNRRQAALYAVWLSIGVWLWAVWRITLPEGILPAIVIVVLFALFWVWGEFSGARRAYHQEVERRLTLLEHERDQQAKIAVGAERARIARELHDVVAHAVSVIVVHADGAAFAVRKQPELAERAIETISSTGREALTELRRLLGVLRSEDSETERTPQPGLAQLGSLVEQVRSAGVAIDLVLEGERRALPPGVELAGYRIVQEALTNVMKHAPEANARVRVAFGPAELELEVENDGRTNGAAGSGYGLAGMRERVELYGGSVEAAPVRGGGFRVLARLPVRRRAE